MSKDTYWKKMYSFDKLNVKIGAHLLSEYEPGKEAGASVGNNPIYRDDSVPFGLIKINHLE